MAPQCTAVVREAVKINLLEQKSSCQTTQAIFITRPHQQNLIVQPWLCRHTTHCPEVARVISLGHKEREKGKPRVCDVYNSLNPTMIYTWDGKGMKIWAGVVRCERRRSSLPQIHALPYWLTDRFPFTLSGRAPYRGDMTLFSPIRAASRRACSQSAIHQPSFNLLAARDRGGTQKTFK